MGFNDGAPTLTMDREDYEMLGKLLMETLALSGLCVDMKNNVPHDPLLLLRWEQVDEESRIIYRTAARELMKVFCRFIKIEHAETGPIDTPPWRQFFDLARSQPMSSEPNVIFNALTCGRLPEA